MIADVIREAESENQIYFLLTAYLEAVRYSDKLNLLPDTIRQLPITDMADVKKRFERLFIELDRESKGLNHRVCTALKEALHIFSTAINRLESIARAKNLQPERRKRQRSATERPRWAYAAPIQEERRVV